MHAGHRAFCREVPRSSVWQPVGNAATGVRIRRFDTGEGRRYRHLKLGRRGGARVARSRRPHMAAFVALLFAAAAARASEAPDPGMGSSDPPVTSAPTPSGVSVPAPADETSAAPK